MYFKRMLSIFIMVLLLVNLVFTASANPNISSDQNEYSNNTKSELPDFNPQIFAQLEEQDDSYILSKGEVPLVTSDSAKRSWLNDLSNVAKGARGKMAEYIRPKGSVMSYGYSYLGFLSVQFPEGTEVNESLINEIYSIFNEEAMKNNISKVPVLFQYSPEIIPGEALDTEDYENEIVDDVENTNNEKQSKDIPGFTLLFTMLAFLIASGRR
ncbi:MAG: hypothetical protein RBT65_06705 [Methanolobus sp.]|nr:hypothetical protein [Methanolobus sp.]